jgi:hypothetical protein
MTTAKGWLWVVFDSLRAIGRLDEHFQFRGHDNILVGQEDGTDSQFEVRAWRAACVARRVCTQRVCAACAAGCGARPPVLPTLASRV